MLARDRRILLRAGLGVIGRLYILFVDALALGYQNVLEPLVEQAVFLGMANDIPTPIISPGYNCLDARETYISALLEAAAAKGLAASPFPHHVP
jgi:hypothetical protein